MTDFTQLATDLIITNTKLRLESRNIHVLVAETGKEAKEKALGLIPKGSEIMTATSTTLDQLELTKIINKGTDYKAVKKTLMSMNMKTQGSEMQKLGAAPDYVIGSVHAVTEDGKIVVASGSGSQLPAYSYGASHVIWVVSTKKIVANLDEAFKRIQEYVLPLEDERMKKVYGPKSGSNINKLFVLNYELNPNRITLIFVKEDLGF